MHHLLIIQKCETVDEALFYVEKTVEENLSRNMLENCIRAELYHTAGAAVTNFTETLPDFWKTFLAATKGLTHLSARLFENSRCGSPVRAGLDMKMTLIIV